jgi:DNA polymerase III subunit delta'
MKAGQAMAFRDIPGNPGIKKILQNALRNGRLPHALLFCGPDGVYKRRTAFTLAQALNCRNAADDACGECESCRAIRRSEETGETWHPDIQELSVETQAIKIEQVRALKEAAYLRPMTARARVFILSEAERLSDEAANSLLKVLEEPPGFSYVLLIAPSPDVLLPTIVSRCRVLTFLPITREEVEKRLRGDGQPDERARALSFVAGGNLERAAVFDWDEVQELRERTWGLVRVLAGEPGVAAAFEGLEARGGESGRESVRDELRERVEVFVSFCRDLLLLHEGGEASLLFNPDYEARLREAAAGLDRRRILEALRGAEGVLAGLPRNLNPTLLVSAFVAGLWSSNDA